MNNPRLTESPSHVPQYDDLLTTIEQEHYLNAIRSHWTSRTTPSLSRLNGVERVYIFTRPEYALGIATAAGVSIDTALVEWSEAIDLMLVEFRKSRRKSVLIEASSAMRFCGQKLPLEFSSIDLALACLAVYQSIELKSTLNELMASSIPLKGWDQSLCLDITGISEQYHQMKEEAKLHSEENSIITAKFEQQEKRLKQIVDEHEKLREEFQEQGQENELLLQQLHRVQEKLEQYFLELQAVTTSPEESTETHAIEAGQFMESSDIRPQSESKRQLSIVRKIADVFRLRKDISLIREDQLFDAVWYLQHYPDVAAAKVDPARHYIKFGAAEGRHPGPDFDSEWYLWKYPDVSKSGINPLVHYIKYGRNERRMKTSWDLN